MLLQLQQRQALINEVVLANNKQVVLGKKIKKAINLLVYKKNKTMIPSLKVVWLAFAFLII